MNGFTLKVIAMITMFIDHMAAILLPHDTVLYLICRYIGRLAFPIFCFLLVEGFYHTRNLKKYLVRLGVFALISELPFDLAFSSKPFRSDFLLGQNVFFTLFIGLSVITLMSIIERKYAQNIFISNLLNSIVLLSGCTAAFFLCTDYDYKGILLIAAFYVFRRNKIVLSLAVVLINMLYGIAIQVFAAVSLIFIWRYNGKRGPQSNKYLFYIFYPAHILLLYIISLLAVFH